MIISSQIHFSYRGACWLLYVSICKFTVAGCADTTYIDGQSLGQTRFTEGIPSCLHSSLSYPSGFSDRTPFLICRLGRRALDGRTAWCPVVHASALNHVFGRCCAVAAPSFLNFPTCQTRTHTWQQMRWSRPPRFTDLRGSSANARQSRPDPIAVSVGDWRQRSIVPSRAVLQAE